MQHFQTRNFSFKEKKKTDYNMFFVFFLSIAKGSCLNTLFLTFEINLCIYLNVAYSSQIFEKCNLIIDIC